MTGTEWIDENRHAELRADEVFVGGGLGEVEEILQARAAAADDADALAGESVEELGLAPGMSAAGVVKSTSVMVER